MICGVQKFDQFLRDRKFTLLTDHKPLLTVFGPKKGIPTTSANRLQRWAIRLMCYTYDIEYCTTSNFGQADGLSRLPIGPDTSFDELDPGDARSIASIHQENEKQLPLRASHIAKATRKESLLHELPNSNSNINDTHAAYFHFENKRNAVQNSTHIILGKKEKFKFSQFEFEFEFC